MMMTAPPIRVTHLFVADEAPDTGKWWACRVTLCGEEIPGPDTPAGNPDQTVYRYCLGCVAEASCLASDDGTGLEVSVERDSATGAIYTWIREIKPDLVARNRWESTR